MAPSLTVPPIPIASSQAVPSSLTPVTPVRGSRKSPANVPPPPKVMTVTGVPLVQNNPHPSPYITGENPGAARALAQAGLMTEQNDLSEVDHLRSQAPAWIEAQRSTVRKMDLLVVTDLNRFIDDSQNQYRSSFLANAQISPNKYSFMSKTLKSRQLVQEEALLKIPKAFKGSKQAVSIEQNRVDDAAIVAAEKKAVIAASPCFAFRFFSCFAFRFFSRALPPMFSCSVRPVPVPVSPMSRAPPPVSVRAPADRALSHSATPTPKTHVSALETLRRRPPLTTRAIPASTVSAIETLRRRLHVSAIETLRRRPPCVRNRDATTTPPCVRNRDATTTPPCVHNRDSSVLNTVGLVGSIASHTGAAGMMNEDHQYAFAIPGFCDISPRPPAVKSECIRSFITPTNGRLNFRVTALAFRIVNGTAQSVQLDKSAACILSQIDIFHGSKQLSSISEYNLLQQILTDFSCGCDDYKTSGPMRGVADYVPTAIATPANFADATMRVSGPRLLQAGLSRFVSL
ncbi:hypothetical protein T492DRAFT_844546 [Pavlovales sp. CCMP2436]|nr:hypothetical protein T492DRAFT_844546 [Pavlovales sp. CCMP2436]